MRSTVLPIIIIVSVMSSLIGAIGATNMSVFSSRIVQPTFIATVGLIIIAWGLIVWLLRKFMKGLF
mgnify:CR=1 FL=1